MKQYHSIPHFKDSKIIGKDAYIFYKYDGSNLRFEWQRKKGFIKFGTRHQLFDKNDIIFGEAIELFQDNLAKDIEYKIIEYFGKKNIPELFTAYAEFFGENSFAGTHIKEDKKELKLFDIEIYKKGFINPNDFIKIFENSEYFAKFFEYTKLNSTFFDKIQNNMYIENLEEGIVAKTILDNKVFMTKIKTKQWIEKLKSKCKNWEDLI